MLGFSFHPFINPLSPSHSCPSLPLLLPVFSPQASQLGVYKAFVDNYKVALETAEKCSQSNNQFQKISEVGCPPSTTTNSLVLSSASSPPAFGSPLLCQLRHCFPDG